ncbi:MAG: hypothetical protein KC492_18915, partial [Myxococcales bacterium]|nr:hypothetical protein [Myxococcales bacterium]
VSTSPTATHARTPARVPALGPWLWGARVDLGVFAGSAAFAVLCVFAMRALGIAPGSLPPWAWLVFVLGIDVSHVYSTLFRTYLDREEVRRHRVRYLVVPLVAYALGVALYAAGALWFWRVLAYVAVFHFIRQQVGWVALYRARAGALRREEHLRSDNAQLGASVLVRRQNLDKLIDEVTVYVSTLYPVLYWHANLAETRFTWFVQGDFVDVSHVASSVLPIARGVWVAALLVFALRQLWLLKQEGFVQLGKCVVVATTALTWYLGIVATNSDAEFTVTNVVVHGVPYMALLYFYGQARRREAPDQPGSQLLVGGLLAFAGSLLLLAFVEELIWDRLVWKDNAWLFGASDVNLAPWVLCFLVPLLSLPQFTHYLLDGVLWRRQDTRENAAQRAAIGM